MILTDHGDDFTFCCVFVCQRARALISMKNAPLGAGASSLTALAYPLRLVVNFLVVDT